MFTCCPQTPRADYYEQFMYTLTNENHK